MASTAEAELTPGLPWRPRKRTVTALPHRAQDTQISAGSALMDTKPTLAPNGSAPLTSSSDGFPSPAPLGIIGQFSGRRVPYSASELVFRVTDMSVTLTGRPTLGRPVRGSGQAVPARRLRATGRPSPRPSAA